MAYIGKSPTAAPLTSSDVADGIITNAKLAQDIISADTALASAPADTDEFLVSDAGTLKRIDYSLIKGGADTIWDLTKNGDQASISDNTLTKITGWTSVTDTDSAWDNTNNKIVIPSGKDGKYLVTVSLYQEQVSGGNSSNDTYTLSLRKNGSAFVGDTEKAQVASNSGTNHLMAILDLDATDYLEIYVHCSAGGGSTTVTDVSALITQPANTWSGVRLAS